MNDSRPSGLFKLLLAVIVALIAGLAAAIAYVYFLPIPGAVERTGQRHDQRKHQKQEVGPRQRSPAAEARLSPKGPAVSIIIDDIGYDTDILERLLATGLDLAYSVIPEAPEAERSAAMVVKAGRELMVHLPCEPLDTSKMKKMRFLEVHLTDAEIRSLTSELLDMVPYAKGVNNHMGSRFTADPKAVGSMLQVIRKRGLFFVDSVTTAHSIAYQIAKGLGVPCLKRDVFLDHDPSPAAVQASLAELFRLASKHGRAVGIGHPHENTVEALEMAARNQGEQSVEVVRPSILLSLGGTQ